MNSSDYAFGYGYMMSSLKNAKIELERGNKVLAKRIIDSTIEKMEEREKEIEDGNQS